MSEHFDAAYWEQRYQDHAGVGHDAGAGHHRMSAQLAAEVGDLTPGTALEAGCGDGATAPWLWDRGSAVTAVAISPTARSRAKDRAAALPGDVAARITWVEADLTTWVPGRGPFDLVSAQYVHPAGGWRELVGRLAAVVAVGGTLLVVDHDHTDEHARAHVGPEELAAALPADAWELVVAETRERRGAPGAGVRGAAGASHRDAVLRAVRRR